PGARDQGAATGYPLFPLCSQRSEEAVYNLGGLMRYGETGDAPIVRPFSSSARTWHRGTTKRACSNAQPVRRGNLDRGAAEAGEQILAAGQDEDLHLRTSLREDVEHALDPFNIGISERVVEDHHRGLALVDQHLGE